MLLTFTGFNQGLVELLCEPANFIYYSMLPPSVERLSVVQLGVMCETIGQRRSRLVLELCSSYDVIGSVSGGATRSCGEIDLFPYVGRDLIILAD